MSVAQRRSYIGDPHEVVTRFVNMVSFSNASPYDYAVEYYNVDAPYFVTSAGYSSYCSGYGNAYRDVNNQYWYRPTLQERWDDDFYGYYGSVGSGCNTYAPCTAYGLNSYGYSSMYTSGIGFYPVCYPRNQNNGGNPPVTPPATDSMKVPRWLTDSIGGRTPDTVGVIPDKGNGRAFQRGFAEGWAPSNEHRDPRAAWSGHHCRRSDRSLVRDSRACAPQLAHDDRTDA